MLLIRVDQHQITRIFFIISNHNPALRHCTLLNNLTFDNEHKTTGSEATNNVQHPHK